MASFAGRIAAYVARGEMWRGFQFWLAAKILAVAFGVAAAAQHIQAIICCANYAPSNAGVIRWCADISIPGATRRSRRAIVRAGAV